MTMELNRRGFLRVATGLAAGATASMPASAWARVAGANDRLRLGVIGVGSRGRSVMGHFLQEPDVEVVALCDVFDASTREALLKAPGAATFVDHRALLEARDVDAVLIATPDHWHARILADAVAAGKDVYVEKPLAHELEEAERMVRAVGRSDRIVQVGLQQRSGSHYQQARAEYFESGLIGDVTQVKTFWHGYGGRLTAPSPPPAGLDWARWLGPAKSRPFDADRFRNWRWYWDYAGGSITDLFTHWLDVVHWFTGQDRPRAVTAIGGRYLQEPGRDAPDTIGLLLEYPPGFMVSFDCSAVPSARGAGIEFYGTGGSLSITRGEYVWRPTEGGQGVTVKPTEEGTGPHVRNFVESVRARRQPSSDIVSGFLSSRATLLARQAFREKKRLHLDDERDLDWLTRGS